MVDSSGGKRGPIPRKGMSVRIPQVLLEELWSVIDQHIEPHLVCFAREHVSFNRALEILVKHFGQNPPTGPQLEDICRTRSFSQRVGRPSGSKDRYQRRLRGRASKAVEIALFHNLARQALAAEDQDKLHFLKTEALKKGLPWDAICSGEEEQILSRAWRKKKQKSSQQARL